MKHEEIDPLTIEEFVTIREGLFILKKQCQISEEKFDVMVEKLRKLLTYGSEIISHEYNIRKTLNENSTILWRMARIELNIIISEYNDWQLENVFDKTIGKKLLDKIENRKETIGDHSEDHKTSEWIFYLNELTEMETFIRKHIE